MATPPAKSEGLLLRDVVRATHSFRSSRQHLLQERLCPPSVLRWRRAGKHRTATLKQLLAGSKITVAYPDEYLDRLADRLMQVNVSHLPVISRERTSAWSAISAGRI
ncbi:hypothetical protein [Bradyrhizobium acaciae]|uniref:hypothetical protein n=1 Tax=Bradyrhizobium acaciae TaxID=2683706 RepID=UPI001E3F358F|nr:hypothetical protein [Bradyrhizobium acaciae]MCC8984663.1 hypothetical protein [Bradyrhizobium acaciae]